VYEDRVYTECIMRDICNARSISREHQNTRHDRGLYKVEGKAE